MTPRTGTLACLAARLDFDRTDADLLDDFVRHRDEAAFAAVVRRHGRAVFGVCRRILGNAADADDAVQATFLVLAKKAHRVAFRADVSAWLFAVAVRASRELLRRRARRREVANVPDAGAAHDFDTEVGRVVLDEVAKLSAAYRAAVVLCELDGVSRRDAARRLGVAEGTLSSRLAAARKQLAVRLTARGVAPALVPFAAGLPAALAETVIAVSVASEVPSSTVSELMEVLMRTGSPLAAGKVLAAVLMLTVVVAAGRSGDDPKPSPIQPAAAKVVVEAKEQGRLALLFREEVRYLTPTGKELQRIDYAAAKKLDTNLHTGSVTIGGGKGLVEVQRYLPSCGRTGPGGAVPLASTNGMKLLSPGASPAVRAVAANEDTEPVVGWEADGRHFVTCAAEMSAVWGFTGYKAFRVNAATGKREQLPFGPEHEVIDVSADGAVFLTYRHRPRAFGLPGFSTDGIALCILDRAGKNRHEPFEDVKDRESRGHRVSPDGKRTAQITALKNQPTDPSPLTITEFFPEKDRLGSETRVVYFKLADGPVECQAVAWSPDGRQIASCWRPLSWTDKQTWHVVVCDPAGRNMRTVATFESKGDEQLRSVDWW
jgi:RNA polymerase sigma factor (sigma-70 family)